MQIKDVSDDEESFTMPKSEDESELVQMLFEKMTELRPDWPLGDRTDMAMSMLSVVKRWAHKHDLASKDESGLPPDFVYEAPRPVPPGSRVLNPDAVDNGIN